MWKLFSGRCVSGSSFLLQSIELGVRADEQASARDGGRGPGEIVEAVLADDVELSAVFDDPRVSVFVEQKHLAVVGPWRCVEAAAAGVQTLAREDRRARLGVGTGQQSRVEENEKPFAADQVAGMDARAARLRPGDPLVALLAVFEADVALPARTDGIKGSVVVAGAEVQ